LSAGCRWSRFRVVKRLLNRLAMEYSTQIAAHLADAFLGQAWNKIELEVQANDVLGKHWKWIPSLVDRMLESLGAKRRARRLQVVRFLLSDEQFLRQC